MGHAVRPKVSVIIITYNHEDTIAACIESIVSQKFSSPFEIIIADDASNDGTAAIVRKYQTIYPDLIKPILREKNIGPSLNFAGALKSCVGDYLAYCDGDDSWTKENKLTVAVEALDSNPDCTLFTHDTELNDKTTNKKTPIVDQDWSRRLVNHRFTLLNSRYSHISGRVFRKMDFPDYGDTFMYCYLLSKGDGYYHDEIMSVYNYTGKGVWSQLSQEQQKNEHFKVYYKLTRASDFKYDDYYSQQVQGNIKSYKKYLGSKIGWYFFLRSKGIPSSEIKKINLDLHLGSAGAKICK